MYISIEDFYEQVKTCKRISREEEIEIANSWKSGNEEARTRLIEGYLFAVAGHIRKMPEQFQTLGLVYYCMQALEKAVDSFNFLQESETFLHRLSWYLRQASTRYIADN
jgi:DNA-directed RNA polymerase sigma subunit (sigma70/sigma32)